MSQDIDQYDELDGRVYLRYNTNEDCEISLDGKQIMVTEAVIRIAATDIPTVELKCWLPRVKVYGKLKRAKRRWERFKILWRYFLTGELWIGR